MKVTRYDQSAFSETYVDCVSVDEPTQPVWAKNLVSRLMAHGFEVSSDDVAVRRRNTGVTTLLKRSIFELCYGGNS